MTEPKTAPAAANGSTEPEKPKVLKLPERRFQLAQSVRNVWHATIDSAWPRDVIYQPTFWAHLRSSGRPAPGDEIIVRPDDMSWRAHLEVRDVGPQAAYVNEIHFKEYTDLTLEKMAAVSPSFEVKWRGPHHKHSVVRISDNATVQPGFESREAGLRWIVDNQRNLQSGKAA
jgi:hypothetical protein